LSRHQSLPLQLFFDLRRTLQYVELVALLLIPLGNIIEHIVV
jgi:hypothetical protein